MLEEKSGGAIHHDVKDFPLTLQRGSRGLHEYD